MKVCSVEGCGRKYSCKGYCVNHYDRFRRHGDPFGGATERFKNRECSIPGCKAINHSLSYCKVHYRRFRKHGDPLKLARNTENTGYCSLEGCEDKYFSYGLCYKHFSISETRRELTRKRRSLKINAIINDLTAMDWKSSLEHFNNACAYCGCSDKKIHADHVVPLSKGGPNTITNIIPACETCNKSKKNTLVEIWYPKKSFYSKQRENKIYNWIGYKAHADVLQATLF